MGDSLMNFSERCRLCIEPKRLSIDIFSEEGRKIKLKSKISKHLSVKVSQSDGLPSKICYQCLFRLETWVSFKQLCMERDLVIKTWSQSYMDEKLCDIDRNFNGEVNHCEDANIREHDAAQSSRLHPNSREHVSKTETFSSNTPVDDTMSDNSLWEIVKIDDTGIMECKRQVRAVPPDTKDIKSTMKHNAIADDIGEQNSDWKRRKVRKPSKAGSSGSDSSSNHQMSISCNEVLSNVELAAASSPICQHSSDSQMSPAVNTSSPSLKRKRGRPSKASLQKEKDLKRIRDHENDLVNVTDVDVQEKEIDEACSKEELEVARDDELNDEMQVQLSTHNRVAIPTFTPIDKDDGSGITEVVLDDPDFGSMKFTLSVVESPVSSPLPNEDYKYYPESCASSCGNISSDSFHREDFEGFESPKSSNFMKPKLMVTSLQADEMPRSRSQVDLRLENCKDFPPAGMKRKRSISASGDFRANFSASDELSVKSQEDFVSDCSNIESDFRKVKLVSKSFESMKTLDDSMVDKPLNDSLSDRNAYSDGEISDSPKKQLRKMILISGKS